MGGGTGTGGGVGRRRSAPRDASRRRWARRLDVGLPAVAPGWVDRLGVGLIEKVRVRVRLKLSKG